MIAAFFDIDGTIFRNSLLTEHFKKLIKYDLLDFSEYDRRVKEAFKLWDERVGNYDNYLGDLTGTYVDAIKGLPTKYNDFVADKVVELKGNKVYAYTRKMIKWHKAQGHLVIFISGSPDFLVSRMAKKWNADDFCGSTYHTDKSGILTGKISPMWDSKNKLKSINSKLIISFTFIMIVTIITIRFFVNTNFKNSFEKYVDDSNKVEINHLIDRKSVV